MDAQFKFRPISSSWVAIHPQPKGVVQFIGGAFFGTFPTVFYRYFLSKIFAQGYTIVALPFRFSFRHWPIAIDLFKEQNILAEEIPKIAEKLNYQFDIYQNKKKYFWIGHSLGCKYITLLEFLSGDKWKEILADSCASYQQFQSIENSIDFLSISKVSIKGQASLLIAPDISDTESAIPQPLAFVAHFLDRFTIGVLPTRKQTQFFIDKSSLFNLTGLISFNQDTIAGSEKDECKDEKNRNNSDVAWLMSQLRQRKFSLLHQELPGKHLEPVGVQIGNYIVDLNLLDKFIKPISSRKLESLTLKFLDDLENRQ
ncbi:DUF1350 family protein [Calothrix sp. PCC 7507]|uniref:DUF1350 family protein n=1 Tax=Calothrix sp. PCC 7507 TaxID=99598 RepID=UPI00029F2963|nr:DUF1350 family protein [Calothrix sp. PCC 7507]AFY32586.1 protein of unknown function DUF1350 [Calothrix sp. PCC 7507]